MMEQNKTFCQKLNYSIVYISLGSNLGNRLQNLDNAIREITQSKYHILQISSVYETPALLPPFCFSEWNYSFLNLVIKIKCFHTNSSKNGAYQLLDFLKTIEKKMGRKKHLKWAPRIIDLDILLFDQEIIKIKDLIIPHSELTKRNFILTALKEMAPSLKVPHKNSHPTVLELCRELKVKIPTWMYIVNITMDSFSDGGEININNFENILKTVEQQYIHIVDLGSESTRPSACEISPQVEWKRLNPYIDKFFNFYKNKKFRPKLSIDTRYAQTAQKAILKGADIINDVSALSDSMIEVLKTTSVEYVLMHSLTVPACPKNILPVDKDPVNEIKKWLSYKINILQKHNINLDRIIFDPGIGFGKNAEQSLEILKRINEFYSFPLRVLVGHSRKSFMKMFSSQQANQRDVESAGVSCFLVNKGVDILRVHKADLHNRFLRGYKEVEMA